MRVMRRRRRMKLPTSIMIDLIAISLHFLILVLNCRALHINHQIWFMLGVDVLIYALSLLPEGQAWSLDLSCFWTMFLHNFSTLLFCLCNCKMQARNMIHFFLLFAAFSCIIASIDCLVYLFFFIIYSLTVENK